MQLDSINQNTNEIQSNYEAFAELEAKFDKFSEKVDELQIQLNPHFYSQIFDDIQLTKREQGLFLGIYTEEDRISVAELAKKAGITCQLCDSIVNSIRAKGIPVMKQLVDEELYVSLDYNFKDLQARKNILKLEASY